MANEKFLSNTSWEYICTLLKTEFAKYTTTDKIPNLFNIFKTASIQQTTKEGTTTTNIVASGSTDTISLINGNNITLTADATNKTVTITAGNTKYELLVGTDETASGGNDNSKKIGLKNLDDNTITYITVPYTEVASKDAKGNVIDTTYAPLASPALTGTPTAPNAETDSSKSGYNALQIANIGIVKEMVNKLSGLVFDGPYESLTDLETQHPTGSTGTIYLVKKTTSTTADAYDEYYWNTIDTTNHYEFFGTTAVDLSDYVKKTDITFMSSTEIQTAWDNAVPASSTT